MKFVISAAGMGSRLGMNTPKCLLPIDKAKLIDYQLALLPPDSDIRIVVGFMEKEVISYVSRGWPNISFVRNPLFATTSNTYSLQLAAQHLKSPFFAIDGDLLIESVSFHRFLTTCISRPKSCVGVTRRTSQEAVGAKILDGHVTDFFRPEHDKVEECEYEWCGIAYINGITITPNRRFVFEELALHLPLPAHEISCLEIDTPKDMENAISAVKSGKFSLPELPQHWGRS